MWSVLRVVPVVREHLARPAGLAYLPTRAHLPEVRGEVEDRASVDRVQVGDVQVQAVDLQQPRKGLGELVRPAVVAVDERSGGRPLGIVAGTASVESNIAG